jgi:hypothetical protein
LSKQGIRAPIEFFALALELGQLEHPAEVGVQQPSFLPLNLAEGFAHSLQPRLELLRQPFSSVRPL